MNNAGKKALAGGVFLILFLCLGGLAAGQPCVMPPRGLVSWWPGDGDAFDVEVGNNGLLQGGATFRAGMVGKAFSFDGANDYMEVPHPVIDVRQPFSLYAWINKKGERGPRDTQVIINKDTRLAGGSVDMGFYVTNEAGIPNQLGLCFIRGTCAVHSIGRVRLNTWTHVAVTFDGSVARFYINGVLDSTHGAVAGTNRALGWQIGGGDDDSNEHFVGDIDEIEVFGRALLPSEIQAIHNAGSAGNCLTLHDALQSHINVLQGLAADPGTTVVALAKLQAALGDLSKEPPDNRGAMGNIKKAVGKLEAAVKSGLLNAEGIQLMDSLVGVAQWFAEEALNQAMARAQRRLNQAEMLRASSAYEDAVSRSKDVLVDAESAFR